MSKAKIEARQAISIIESQLKFLDQAECFDKNRSTTRVELNCSTDFDRSTLFRMSEDELKYLQELSTKENAMEVKKEKQKEENVSSRSFV